MRVWNESIYKFLETPGCCLSEYDESLYTRTERDSSQAIILVNVDDILIVGCDESMVHKVVRQIEDQVLLRVEN